MLVDSRSYVEQTHFQGQWATREMKIQSSPDRVESSVNRLYFVCAAIFLLCATSFLKLEAKNPRILSEILKCPDWGENGLCASFVPAGCDVFRLCSIRSKVTRRILHFKVTHSIVYCVYPKMKIGFLRFARKLMKLEGRKLRKTWIEIKFRNDLSYDHLRCTKSFKKIKNYDRKI